MTDGPGSMRPEADDPHGPAAWPHEPAQDTLRAIAAGEIDAFVVSDGAGGSQVFSLQSADRPYQTFVESMRDGAATVSSTGVILFANGRLIELLSRSRDAVVGKLLSEFLIGDARIELDRVAHGDGATVERQLLDGCGQPISVLIGAAPLAVSGEDLTCLTFTDLRPQKAAESDRLVLVDRLHQAQRAESLGQLAGGLAHDFNNLIGIILNYAALISEESDGRVKADAEEIRVAAAFASRLTGQLLTFARRPSVHPEVLDLNVVLREMFDLLNGVIGAGVKLIVSTEELLPPICADRGQIDQILLNLVVNARDAMPDGGTVTMAARTVTAGDDVAPRGSHPERRIELSVTDDGTGMSTEVMARAFDRFFTTKPAGKGCGLGLATVHGIVTESGGTIGISSGLGKGTSIRIILPVAGPDPR